MGHDSRNKLHDDHDIRGVSVIGGKRTNAKHFGDYPLNIEQAARYIEVPISVLRAGMRGELMFGIAPPKVWQQAGRSAFFQVEELDNFILRRAGVCAS